MLHKYIIFDSKIYCTEFFDASESQLSEYSAILQLIPRLSISTPKGQKKVDSIFITTPQLTNPVQVYPTLKSLSQADLTKLRLSTFPTNDMPLFNKELKY